MAAIELDASPSEMSGGGASARDSPVATGLAPTVRCTVMMQTAWLRDFNWDKLEAGKLESPHKMQCEAAYSAALKEKRMPGKDGAAIPPDTQKMFSSFSNLFSAR